VSYEYKMAVFLFCFEFFTPLTNSIFPNNMAFKYLIPSISCGGSSVIILTLNCGSSSVKYQLYRWDDKIVLANGMVERVGMPDAFIQYCAYLKTKQEVPFPCPDHKTAIDKIIDTLLTDADCPINDKKEISAVGHRMVHGGEVFTKSVIIDDKNLRAFEALSSLAPLHNPPALSGIKAAMEIFPTVPHCAILDTAWHQTMPETSFIYALPYSWYKKHGVRRYGFHGSSLLYVAKRAAVLLGKDPFQVNLITLHIGNGVSADAVKNGLSFDTSMGLTPLEGLVMGTRPGDHDAAIGYYIMKQENLSPDEMENQLNKMSGVFGITEKYKDRRDIIEAAAKGDKQSALALEIEAYRIKKYIGAYYAALGHVDAIIFTAGVGEMGALIREKAVSGLENLGIEIDKEKNNLSMTRNTETEISTTNSRVKIFVIPTDEELVMTEDTYALLTGIYDIHTQFTYSFQHKEYVNNWRAPALEKELREKPALKNIIARIP